jgi:hypothetical protein
VASSLRVEESLKNHNILIEPWRGNPGPRQLRGAPGFRWTVSYEADGRCFAQGYEDTHTDARAAAEAFLVEKGVNLNWQGEASSTVSVIRPPIRRRA